MNFDCTKLFEIPIYRCSLETYRKEEELKKERYEMIHRRLYPNSDFDYVSWPSYRYNEIIGWIVIFAYERRVRTEYWFVRQKVRRGLIRKQFENKGKFFQIRIRDNAATSKEIFHKLKDTVLAISREWPFSKYYFDLECFDNIASRLNWRDLLHLTSS
jgi:hypothetical protein